MNVAKLILNHESRNRIRPTSIGDIAAIGAFISEIYSVSRHSRLEKGARARDREWHPKMSRKLEFVRNTSKVETGWGAEQSAAWRVVEIH